MASNFRILVHRNSDNVHLKLLGDFDGISADELLNALKRNDTHARKIFVHTSGLRKIYPSGRELLQKNLYSTNGQSASLVFTDKYGTKIGRKGIDFFIPLTTLQTGGAYEKAQKADQQANDCQGA